jgi:hypothetical protein
MGGSHLFSTVIATPSAAGAGEAISVICPPPLLSLSCWSWNAVKWKHLRDGWLPFISTVIATPSAAGGGEAISVFCYSRTWTPSVMLVMERGEVDASQGKVAIVSFTSGSLPYLIQETLSNQLLKKER